MTTTPTYRIEIRTTDRYAWTPIAWDTRRYGRPTDDALDTFVSDLEASTRPGGVNAHLGTTYVRTARVIRQADDTVVVDYTMPAFRAV